MVADDLAAAMNGHVPPAVHTTGLHVAATGASLSLKLDSGVWHLLRRCGRLRRICALLIWRLLLRLPRNRGVALPIMLLLVHLRLPVLLLRPSIVL